MSAVKNQLMRAATATAALAAAYLALSAWLLWRTYYLGRLLGAENKLRVLSDWMLESFFERDTARLEAA